tara:strand:- start:482 stop:1258 length:777 start_codon:yes stop_codon:yes gene_type:complete
MPGIENEVIKYVFSNKKKIKFNHLKNIISIKIPKKKKLIKISNLDDIEENSSSDSSKKADVFFNDIGISIKAKNGNPYNKLYRKDFSFMKKFIKNDDKYKQVVKNLEEKLKKIHSKDLKRDVFWKDIIEEKYFKPVLKYLMMDGKPSKKNNFPAKFLLIHDDSIKSNENLALLSFDEYFENYKDKIYFAFRRVWFGATSSEHERAKNICYQHLESEGWCFKTITGKPAKRKDGKSIWRSDIMTSDRRTAYYLNIACKK